MKSSGYFRKSIYYDQSPAALDYWEARVHSIFVADDSQSWLDAYSNTTLNALAPVNGLDGQPHGGNTYPPDYILRDTHKDSLSARDVVQQIPHTSVAFSNAGQESERHCGLRLQKVRHKSELLQFLSVRCLSVQIMFVTY